MGSPSFTSNDIKFESSFQLIANKLRLLTKSFATTSSGLVFRPAAIKDVDIFTCWIIKEGWHVGPYDYPCGYAFDPEGFFMGEVDGELASHICAVRYPNHHAHCGGAIVTEKFRGKGFHMMSALKAIDVCDQNYTIGTNIDVNLRDTLARMGGEIHWDTHIATLSLDKVSKVCDEMALPGGVLWLNPFRRQIWKKYWNMTTKFLE